MLDIHLSAFHCSTCEDQDRIIGGQVMECNDDSIFPAVRTSVFLGHPFLSFPASSMRFVWPLSTSHEFTRSVVLVLQLDCHAPLKFQSASLKFWDAYFINWLSNRSCICTRLCKFLSHVSPGGRVQRPAASGTETGTFHAPPDSEI